jgi:hypothetical protein
MVQACVALWGRLAAERRAESALFDCRFLRSRGRANGRNSKPSGAPEGLMNRC